MENQIFKEQESLNKQEYEQKRAAQPPFPQERAQEEPPRPDAQQTLEEPKSRPAGYAAAAAGENKIYSAVFRIHFILIWIRPIIEKILQFFPVK